MTDRKGRQKTLITKPYMNELLDAAVDLVRHAGDKTYKEAMLIRVAIRETAAHIAEELADTILEETIAKAEPGDRRRIRSEVEARRRKLRQLAEAARLHED